MKLATLCYVQKPGHTLMLHRVKKKNDMHQGKWNGLGGKVEAGESPEECAVREVWEESGLTCRNPRLRGFITFPAFDEIDDWYTFLYTFDEFEGELIDSPEGNLAWIENERLLALNLWPGDRVFLPWVFQDSLFSAKFIYEKGEFIRHAVTFYGADGAMTHEAMDHKKDMLGFPKPGMSFQPIYTPADDTYCWLCSGPVVKRHCKIICEQCGFVRDCSDP
ncbi:MAG: 8-oxo-dGTP diphosphatase [Caldilineaceae bacterium]